MAEYIEREAILKIIDDNCPHDKGGYNTEEEMGAGATCYYIRKDVDNIPTADVVLKSEVAKIFEEIERNIFVIKTPYGELYCIPTGYLTELKRNIY